MLPGRSDGGYLFAVQDFEIHRVVDLSSPCFIDVGERRAASGPARQPVRAVIDADIGIPDYQNPPASATEAQKRSIAATAHQRMANITALAGDGGLKARDERVDRASIPTVDADCTDTSKIPPPTCTDDASNKRRLEMCQQFWHDEPGLLRGHGSRAHGAARRHDVRHGRRQSPINLAPVGGAQFFVDEALAGFDAYAMYWQFDDANGDGKPDYPRACPAMQTHPGTLLLYGTPTTPTRGVMHVHMTRRRQSSITAELAIFANLDQDTTHF